MIEVGYVDHMGSDLSVVNAARVSFAKESDWDYLNSVDGQIILKSVALKEVDKKLIQYLAKHKHTSPFGHAFASFRVKAPVFVARQLVKHEYLRWNETSRRYVDDPPDFFIPDKWRKRADNVKQGSGEGEVTTIPHGSFLTQAPTQAAKRLHEHAVHLYEEFLEAGMAPEQARMILPQSMMTEWVWSGSLDAFASMCVLRLDPHTQYESRLVAEAISEKMEELFPVSWAALING